MKLVVSRRRLLGAAAALPLWFSRQVPGQPGEGEREEPIRISLAAFSLREELTTGDLDLFGFIDWCARIGISGAELTSYYFPETFDLAYLRRLRRRAFDRGVTVTGTAVSNNFCLPPGSEREGHVLHVNQWIDYAAEMFAPHIRIFAGTLPAGVSRERAIGWVADSIRTVLERAEKRGVVVGLENHGGITARAEDHLAICDQVGEHPWFGINLDTGNYHTSPYRQLELAAQRAVNVQFKVEVRGPGGNLVPADFERVREIIVNSGYRGWVALEYEAAGNPRIEIPRHLRRLQSLFERCA